MHGLLYPARRDSGQANESKLLRQLDGARAEAAGLRTQVAELDRARDVALAVAEESRALLAQHSYDSAEKHKTEARAAPLEPGKALGPFQDLTSMPTRANAMATQGQREEQLREAERRLEEAASDMGEVQKLAGTGLKVLQEGAMDREPLGEDSQKEQRSQLVEVLQALVARAEGWLTSRVRGTELAAAAGGAKTAAERRQPIAGTVEPGGRDWKGEAENLATRLREMERSERFLKEELERASTSLAQVL